VSELEYLIGYYSLIREHIDQLYLDITGVHLSSRIVQSLCLGVQALRRHQVTKVEREKSVVVLDRRLTFGNDDTVRATRWVRYCLMDYPR
jgi:hypothetical protein